MANKFNVGDKVCMKDNKMHCDFPEYYPNCRAVGKVLEVLEDTLYVDRGEGSGVAESNGEYAWYVEKDLTIKAEE